MYIKEFRIKNFRLFKDFSITFNKDINIFTGTNNSGKTTLLEAIALWHECFSKRLQQAARAEKNYKRGDYVINTQNRYVQFDQINSVRSPRFEDIFYQCDKKNKISLSAIFSNDRDEIEVAFNIVPSSGQAYEITLDNLKNYDFFKFNEFFINFPNPVQLSYASPVATILPIEKFVTNPQIKEAMTRRESASVLRNRLYSLYHNSQQQNLFNEFLGDLSYILGSNFKIKSLSDIRYDTNASFHAEILPRDIEKDITLFGSGTLQIIEILLSLYSADKADLFIVLLDEPDSHIHRSVQTRLIETLVKFSSNNQIFLSTHNESLIRSAQPSQLFHLDGQSIGNCKSLEINNFLGMNNRFKGLFPSPTKLLISSLTDGDTNGLDFINAIESDVILFVEGQNDAKAIDLLLKQQVNNRKKYAYWVLGSISDVFERILHYQTMFSAIKNQKTLWEKSILVIDRDYLIDKHRKSLSDDFASKLKLKTHLWTAYTFEATLLTDLLKLASLLVRFLSKNGISLVNEQDLLNKLQANYNDIKDDLISRCDNEDFYQKETKQYKGGYREKLQKVKVFEKDNPIKEDNIDLMSVFRKHIKDCLANGEYYKLTNKDDVGKIINLTLNQVASINFDITSDFIPLLQEVDKSLWFDEWNFLLNI